MITSNGITRRLRAKTHRLLLSPFLSFRRWLLAPVFLDLYFLEENIMSALDDAVARITLSVQKEIQQVVDLLNAPNPDVDAAVASLNALSDSLDADDAPASP